MSAQAPTKRGLSKGQWTIVAVFLTCALPIVAAFYLYFFNKPEGTNNYGTILDPQVPVSQAVFKNINGEDFTMAEVANKWVLISTIQSSCDELCQKTLYYQRQARASKGKEQGRIERVVFVTDDGPLETLLLRQFPDVHFVRATPEQLSNWLPLQGGIVGSKGTEQVGGLHDHVFVADPLGHVMMRFPPNATLEFDKFRKDISRLLWASNIG
ncbi:SCO family protein [Limnobacter sp.]|uniref:SCO family protein n=1 Tax=Limnobacter sp. TaxID=2003368 RepID=UPI003518FA6F